ncbi:hypothetical protein ACLX1H_004133 [Fusarium chlamydosporum]
MYFLATGFTGEVATKNAQDTIAYGTKIVGGVTKNPGNGTHLDLPLYGSVREAADKLKPDVSAVFVRGSLTAGAIIEAIEAEIPLIVSVAEHVPVHDMLRVHEGSAELVLCLTSSIRVDALVSCLSQEH